MKISIIQFAPHLANLEATLRDLQRLMPSAAGSDLVVLPELCNSGYNFISKEQAWDSSENAIAGRFTQYLISACHEHGCAIVSGLNERDGDKLYNSAILVTRDGLLGKYRKLHLYLNEKDFFLPGNLGAPIFELNGIRLGMLICFDWWFAEVWRLLALKGADIICHPSNLVIPGKCQRAVPIHAMTNKVYVVTANRIGTEGDLWFTGGSVVCDTKGTVIGAAPEREEAVLTVEIDPFAARNKAVNLRNNLFDDRRTDVYAELFTIAQRPEKV
jgi:predicted amidohydrolase